MFGINIGWILYILAAVLFSVAGFFSPGGSFSGFLVLLGAFVLGAAAIRGMAYVINQID